MRKGLMILPIGAGIIGQDDVPLVRIMDSDETPTTITVYGVVDTVQPVTSVTWTVNGVEQSGDVSKSPVLELTNLQPETSYAITLRATNINGESSASARTITTKKITTVTPNDVLSGVSYYNQDVYYTGNIPTKDETDIVVNGRDVTVPTGYYAESETVSVSSEYIIPTGTKNISDNGTEDVTQYANVNVNVPASAVDTGTKQITSNGNGQDVVGYANVDVDVQPTLYTPSNVDPTTLQQTITAPTGYDGLSSVTVNGVTSSIDSNIQAGNIKEGVTILGVTGTFDPTPTLDTLNVTPSTSSQTLTPTGGIDGWDEVLVGPVGASIDQNIQAGNIKDGVVILGVTGSYSGSQPTLQGINVIPTKQSQVITPTGGVDGFDEVNVFPVTALIDNNITPENIKKDVAILGVTGTLEGGISPTGTLNIVSNGNYDITNYANVYVNVASGDYNELCFTAQESNCAVGMYNSGTNATTTKPLMYYSTDNKQTWNEWDYTTITLANVGDKVYFYGYNINGFSHSGTDYSNFTTRGRVGCSGNVMTLITRYGDREVVPSESCFVNLFNGASITTAPALPATTLTQSCYSAMFQNCASLTTAQSELPATTLASNCYQAMFYNCSSMTTAPSELPATTLADACYQYMFKNCTSLTTAPELPATVLANDCYLSMFQGCTSLTTAQSELPATTLTSYCYNGMFYDCTSLVNAPDLPATNIAPYCYTGMFYGCTSLTTAPELPATILQSYCYQDMFNGCTSLTSTPVMNGTLSFGNFQTMFANCSSLNVAIVNTTNWEVGHTFNWLGDVAQTGTFYKAANLVIPTDTSDGVPTGWTVVDMPYMSVNQNTASFTVPTGWSVYYTTDGTVPTTSSNLYTQPIDLSQFGEAFTFKYILTDGNVTIGVLSYDYYNMFYIEALENNTVLNTSNIKQDYYWNPVKVEYSTDKTTWADVSSGMSSYTLANTGDRVYFRKKNVDGDTWTQGSILTNSGTIKAGGSLEYAVYHEITGNRPASGGCVDLFRGCTGLVDASELKLFGSTYLSSFEGCSNLVTAPSVLPATTLVDNAYQCMFQNCTSLTTPPVLPATTLSAACYQSMFSGCTSLTTAPALPATTLADACYSAMFIDCTSLTVAPSLPATTLTQSCYSLMFCRCTSLATAPSIQATILASRCCEEMFLGCSSLITAPDLPATTLASYCYNGMFKNCTNLVNPPYVLPAATQLYTASYKEMFYGCTSLTSTPIISAEVYNMYGITNMELDNMFENCTSLNTVTIETDKWTSGMANNWLSNVSQTGTFNKPSLLVIGSNNGEIPYGANGIPTGWTVVDAQ